MQPDTPGLSSWAHGVKGFFTSPTADTCVAGGGKVFDYFLFSDAFDGLVGEAWIGTSYGTTPHRPVFVCMQTLCKDSKVLTRRKWKSFPKEAPEEPKDWVDTTAWDWQQGQLPTCLPEAYKQWITAAEDAWCTISDVPILRQSQRFRPDPDADPEIS